MSKTHIRWNSIELRNQSPQKPIEHLDFKKFIKTKSQESIKTNCNIPSFIPVLKLKIKDQHDSNTLQKMKKNKIQKTFFVQKNGEKGQCKGLKLKVIVDSIQQVMKSIRILLTNMKTEFMNYFNKVNTQFTKKLSQILNNNKRQNQNMCRIFKRQNEELMKQKKDTMEIPFQESILIIDNSIDTIQSHKTPFSLERLKNIKQTNTEKRISETNIKCKIAATTINSQNNINSEIKKLQYNIFNIKSLKVNNSTINKQKLIEKQTQSINLMLDSIRNKLHLQS